MTTNESQKTKQIRELIANITARRNYINTHGNLSLTEVNRHKRQIRAWERELENLGGEMPKNEPRYAACGGLVNTQENIDKLEADLIRWFTGEIQTQPHAVHPYDIDFDVYVAAAQRVCAQTPGFPKVWLNATEAGEEKTRQAFRDHGLKA
jgi:hypothetical protein